MSDDEKIAKAMAALDTMAEIWAAQIGLNDAVKAMTAQLDRERRIVVFVKQAYAEGLFTGRRSLDEHPPEGAHE